MKHGKIEHDPCAICIFTNRREFKQLQQTKHGGKITHDPCAILIFTNRREAKQLKQSSKLYSIEHTQNLFR